MAQLTWVDKNGAGHLETGKVKDLVKKLPTLRCEATLRAEDGEVIGGVEKIDYADDKRIKWNWWYDSSYID